MTFASSLAAGFSSGYIRGPLGHPDGSVSLSPADELCGRLRLDPAVRAALRGGAAARARVPAQRAARRRREPPGGVAGLAARPSRGRAAGNDGEPGDRSLSRTAVVRARSGSLRRAIRAAAGGARPGEPRGGAGGAGARVRGDRRLGRAVRGAGGDRRGYQTRNAEVGTRNRRANSPPLFRVPRSAFHVSVGVGKREVRGLGSSDPRQAGWRVHRPSGGGGEVSRLPARRRAAARSRRAPPAPTARAAHAGAARRAARGGDRIAVRARRPPLVAARGGRDRGPRRRPRAPPADQRLPDLLHAGGGPGDARAPAPAADRARAAASPPPGGAPAGGGRPGPAPG